MPPARPRIGLALSAVGGILTAISVYQPWYGLGFTPAAVGAAEQEISSVPGLSQYADRVGAAASTVTGHPLIALSAHQVLHHVSVALLVIGAAAILLSLIALASAAPAPPLQTNQLLAGLGVIGAILSVYRMIDPPNPAPGFITLSLRVGSFIALAGCAAIVAGSLWPTREPAADAAPADPAGVWSELSGWTPS